MHKIKGVAGNLRLNRLHELCSRIEKDVLRITDSDNELLQTLVLTLEQTLDAIDERLAPVGPQDDGEHRAMDISLSGALAAQCREDFIVVLNACEQHDPDAAEAAIASLGAYTDAYRLEQINHQLQQFDFCAALVMLYQLADELAIEIETS